MTAICPSCKTTTVERKLGSGKTPRCKECCKSIKDNKHYDKNGIRYGTAGRKTIRTCKYCKEEYERTKNDHVDPVCRSCSEHHKKVKAFQNIEARKNFPHTFPEYRLENRLKNKLSKAGLPPDWYDRQLKICSICGSDSPGRRGRWHIDHNHECCKSEKRGQIVGCHNCIRGLLCNTCNMALGLLKDSPELLLSAVKYLNDHPLLNIKSS